MQLTADQGAWNSWQNQAGGKLRWKMQKEKKAGGVGGSRKKTSLE